MTDAALLPHAAPVRIEPFRPRDLIPYFALLAEARLPTAGLDAHLGNALIVRERGLPVGGATVEVWEVDGLLRSVVVAPRLRSRGVGRQLTEAALGLAGRRGLRALYLLTETAAGFFTDLGFRTIPRAEVPAAVRSSVEFRGVCPESATVMVKTL